MATIVENELDRIAPVERQLLGCILWSDTDGSDGLDVAAEILVKDDFGVYVHGLIFGVCLELRQVNAPVTLTSVFERLKATGAIADLGPSPAEWLADISQVEGSDLHARYYAGLVREAADRRKFRHVAAEIMCLATRSPGRASDTIAEAEQLLFGLTDSTSSDGAVGSAQLVRDGLEQIDQRAGRDGPDGLLTGFCDLDHYLGGIKPGNVIVVGARPSAGKTALGLAIGLNVAKSGNAVYIASLEMPRSELTDRIFSIRSGVPLKLIQSGRLNADNADRVQTAASHFGREPFFIDDSASMSAARLSSAVRRAVRRQGVRLVVVDYLQLMQPENEKDPRHLQVGTLARRMKQLARLCNVPLLLLAQLNRESENRTGGKPKLSDLRESGEVECHADIVLLLHPHPEQPKDAAIPKSTDVIVAKNRNGPVGDFTLAYRGICTRFENLANEKILDH